MVSSCTERVSGAAGFDGDSKFVVMDCPCKVLLDTQLHLSFVCALTRLPVALSPA